MTLGFEVMSRRDEVVDALLGGAVRGELALRAASDTLGLPRRARYVIVTCDGGGPGLVARVREAGLPSAWRAGADGRTGLVGVRAGADDVLRDALQGAAPAARVGISPFFDSLDRAPAFVELARASLVAAEHRGVAALAFDEDPVGVAMAASAVVGDRAARTVLAGLDRLQPDQRESLLATLRAWVECGGSTPRAAQRMFLHRNTVRARLRRLEELTGRSLAAPADIAALYLALATPSWPGRSDGDESGRR